MKTIIIGGVAGGATAATRLRRLDENMEIILLERGGYISYANCGLPYYMGDIIKEREALLLQTPKGMKNKYNIDVRVESEAVEIIPDEKKVIIKNNGKTYEETYDNLVIATGSSPLKPKISGIDLENIHTLWTVTDTDKIRSVIDDKTPRAAAVIGGGFIGLEMAENLSERGINVTLIEAQDQVMAPMDYDMAQILAENMDINGVELHLGDGVASFEKVDSQVKINLNSGESVLADIVILAIGVKPNSQLAKEAGIELNQRGGIKVDDYLMTSKANIYAVGDVIEINNLATGEKGMIPLAGPANKQGRIVANNIAGEREKYEGTLGTSIAKVFDLNGATVGANEKTLKAKGLIKDKDYYVALINQRSHAGYYPGATPMTLKLIFGVDKKIFGAQIVGKDSVDKRIDTIATTMKLGGNIDDLAKLELAYAPPFSSAKDPVNMLGFVAGNILSGKAVFIKWDEITEEHFLLDVTEEIERMVFQVPGSYHIPFGEIRNRLNEIPRDKTIVTYCAIGVRAYNVSRILMENGFEDVRIAFGGTTFYKSLNYKHEKRMISLPSSDRR